MAASLNADTAVAGQGPANILLVDDNPARLLSYRAILAPLGENLIEANSGTEALRRVMEDEFAVILLDVNMPGMDGYETMRAIRARPELRSLPIIALTAKAMKGDREKCIEAGASDYIAKPVHTDQLLALLRQWLHR